MKKVLYIIGVLTVLLSSCEKVIKLDLNEANPKIVVEGFMTNIIGENYVHLSNTSSYYDSSSEDLISGAKVSVESNSITYVFDEVSKGIYNSSTLDCSTNSEYKLTVGIEEETIEAISFSSSVVKIDSIEVEASNFGKPKDNKEGEDVKEDYSITCYFKDNPNEVNFYRLRMAVGNELEDGFYVVSDEHFNGKTIPYSFDFISLDIGDEIIIELMGVDESSYRYYETLIKIKGSSTTPGNPPTNIVGNAIGIFEATTIDSLRYTVVE